MEKTTDPKVIKRIKRFILKNEKKVKDYKDYNTNPI